jgi:hypothetical protein
MRRIEALALLAATAALAACGSSGHTPGSSSTASTRHATESAGTATQTTSSTPAKQPHRRSEQPPIRIGKQGRPVAPQRVVTVAFTKTRLTSPNLVCGLYSQRLLDRSYGGEEGCRSAVRSGGLARSIEIRSVNASGDTASVVAVPTGGPSSGERLTIRLARQGLTWRIAAIRSNVKVGP